MSDHVLFKRRTKNRGKIVVEWPVKNYSVIRERDLNVSRPFEVKRFFTYQQDAVRYEFS